MVINKDPEYEKRRAAQERLERTEDERKKDLLAQMQNESTSVLALAMFYAKGYEEYGVDITEKWVTTQQQTAVLQQIFNKGYEQGIKRGRELERESIKNMEKHRAETKHEPFYDVNANGNFGKDTISRSLRNVVQPANEQHRRNSTKKRRKRK